MLYMFGSEMQMHVLAVEYPGYGLYKTSKPNEEMMKEDAMTVFDYLTQCVGISQKDIILFGRSMGSGPSTYLSSINNAYTLLLMSAFTSIKDAAKALFGWAGFISILAHEKFRNIDTIKSTKCPVFFLHGQQDTIVPHTHSIQLNEVCPMESFLHLPPNMDHNEFQLIDDLVVPFKTFMNSLDDGQVWGKDK